jgi:heme iron utilization protein
MRRWPSQPLQNSAWHGNSKKWVDYDDSSFYCMDIVDVYYVGGFGVMGWVAAAEYYAARPDPLADSANEIIRHMNEDHADAISLLTKKIIGAESQRVEMTSVDRLGFHVRIRMPDDVRIERIPFSREANSAAETRKVLIEMATAARMQ